MFVITLKLVATANSRRVDVVGRLTSNYVAGVSGRKRLNSFGVAKILEIQCNSVLLEVTPRVATRSSRERDLKLLVGWKQAVLNATRELDDVQLLRKILLKFCNIWQSSPDIFFVD